MLPMRTFFVSLFFTLFVYSGWSTPATPVGKPDRHKKIRLFIIGNSFSQNAATYLPQLAKEGGHELSIGRAELGGCSLQRHWEIAAAAEADTTDPKGKAYKGKSLRNLLSEGEWDVVTLQQYSLLSGDVNTYRPYAEKLIALVRSIQPQAKIVFHQTWAYRADAKAFGKINGETTATSDLEMWQKSRAAYRAIAAESRFAVIPTGDAFRSITADAKWGFKKDTQFNYAQPVSPVLPDQTHSLHVGYRWTKDGKLSFDANHANTAGCYLGSLVWYSFLFDESPARLTFTPGEVTPAMAAQLKKVAWATTKKGKKEDKKNVQ